MSYSHVDCSGVPLDEKILPYLKKSGGFYIEIGGYDGLTQSNTKRLEDMGWTGILIEPSPSSFSKCVNNRPKSKVINAACVASNYPHDLVEGDFNGSSMSSVGSKRTGSKTMISVKALKLKDIIESERVESVDFLSLDVEGYEYDVLDGMDIRINRPKVVLIEIYTKDYERIVRLMTDNGYTLVGNMTNYNKIDNPKWDGTHNDYLFISR